MLRILILGCALLGPLSATAQDLALRDAVRLTLERNPQLQGHRFTLSASMARRDQAALRPGVDVSLDTENFLGTNRISSFNDTEITLRLGTVLELGSKRERRITMAERERDVVALTQDAQRLDILADVTRHFVSLLESQHEKALADQAVGLAIRAGEIVKQRVNSGRAAVIEQTNAELATMDARRDLARATTRVSENWAKLAAAWGGTPEQTGRATGELFDLPVIGDFAGLSKLIEQNPDIAKFASERRVAESALRLAEAARTPDLSISAGVRRLQADRSQAAVLSLSVPLGTSGRSRPFEDEARNRLSAVEFEEAARRNQLLATLFGLHQHLLQKRSEFNELRDKAVPLAESAVKATEDGFRAGRFSLFDLTYAQQRLIILRRDAIGAAASFHLLILEIERLTGRSAADMPSQATPIERTSNNAR